MGPSSLKNASKMRGNNKVNISSVMAASDIPDYKQESNNAAVGLSEFKMQSPGKQQQMIVALLAPSAEEMAGKYQSAPAPVSAFKQSSVKKAAGAPKQPVDPNQGKLHKGSNSNR